MVKGEMREMYEMKRTRRGSVSRGNTAVVLFGWSDMEVRRGDGK